MLKVTTMLPFALYVMCTFSELFLHGMNNQPGIKLPAEIVNTRHNHPYDLFHWQTAPDAYDGHPEKRFDISYSAAGNVTRRCQ